MSSQQNCDSEVTEAGVIRAVYPRHTMKRLALAMGVPLDTARHWLFRKMSASRRRELALALLAEMDAQEVERTALRRRLAEWAAQGSGGENASLDRAGPGLDRTAAPAKGKAVGGA